jgi:hypothetical protein
MASDAILRTYGDSSIKEDVVLNAVEILTAQEDQISNIIQKSKAIALVHNYLTDTLRTAASRAVAEAEDYTGLQASTPSRLTNVVEHIAIPFKVTRAQQSAQHYHGMDEKERQTQKALKDFGNSLEFDLVRSTLVSGVSGTVPKMAGIIAAISKSTNYTTHTSTTALVASILDGLMKLNWENSNGDVATDLYMGSFLRNVVDQFAQKSNVVVNNGTISTIIKTVSSYETAMGTVRFHKHRYIQQSTDAHGRILAIRPEKLAIAWFEKPYVDTELARTGPYDFRAIAGSLTLEVRNQDSNWFAAGFVNA